MAFEVFTGAGTKNRDFISVTLSKSFGFPRSFIDNNHIKDNSKVVVLFDPEEKKIALYFSDKNPKFGYSFRRSKNPKHGGTVIAHSFFDSKHIDTSRYAQRYDYEKVQMSELGYPEQQGSAYVIELTPAEQPAKTRSMNAVNEIVDEPINLDDIPF